MKCAIMQPTYLPWIGYFDLIDQVDKFVFLDSVQLVRRSWQVRNRIKTAQGELYLSIPIKKRLKRSETMLNNAYLDDSQNWRKKHLKSICFAYCKSQHYDEIYKFLEEVLFAKEITLSELTIHIIIEICRKIGIKKEFIKSSEIKHLYGKKDVLLAVICKQIGCNEFISAKGSSVYIEENSTGGELIKNNFRLYYHNYEHPEYGQNYGAFMPYLSIVDLLFCCGFNRSLSIIRTGRRKVIDCQSMHQSLEHIL